METIGVAIMGVVFILLIIYYAYKVYIGKTQVPKEKKRGIYIATLFSVIFIAAMILNLYYRFI